MASNKLNLAEFLYYAYPDSDLLNIDPEKDLMDMATLCKATEKCGDGLFRFLAIELHEVSDGSEHPREEIEKALERAIEDITDIRQYFEGIPEQMELAV